MEQVLRAEVTNADLSDLIGVTVSQVSRLRNGKRGPSITTIHQIHLKLGWSDKLQMRAMRGGVYGQEFENFLRGKYGD